MSKKKTTVDTETENMPAPIADEATSLSVVTRTDIAKTGADGAELVENTDKTAAAAEKPDALPEPQRYVEYAEGEPRDERMSGGYASVRGSSYAHGTNRLVWIVLIVMTVLAIVIGICSSLITAHLMRKGDTPPIINTTDNISQVTGVVAGRKTCVAEVACNTAKGSGIIMKRDGNDIYVMTNAHVILSYIRDGHAPSVRFYGEDKFYEARVVGYDTHYDVAVIMLSHETLYTVYDLDGSDYFTATVQYNEGDRVVSIGNAMGFGIASYDGIISRASELLECDELLTPSTKKTVPVLRTTAVINAGMSGGALFDMNGNLIGLGTYRMSNSAGVDQDGAANADVEDTGFVTPVSVLYPVYKNIMRESDGGAVALTNINLRNVNTSAIGWIYTPFGFNLEYRNRKLTVISTDGAPSSVKAGDVITRIGRFTVTDDICSTVGAFISYNRQGSGETLKIAFENAGTVTFGDYKYAL